MVFRVLHGIFFEIQLFCLLHYEVIQNPPKSKTNMSSKMKSSQPIWAFQVQTLLTHQKK